MANPTVTQLQALTGEYYSDGLDATFRRPRNGRVVLMPASQRRGLPLMPLSGDAFAFPNAKNRFHRDASGAPTSFTYTSTRVIGLAFRKKN